MPRRARTAVAAGCLGVVLITAACGSDHKSAAPAAGCTTDSTAGVQGSALLPVPPAQVTVLNPGADPRSPVAYQPDRTTPQQVTLTATSALNSSAGPDGPQSDTTSVTMPLTARAHCVDASDVEMTLGTPTSPDPDLDASLRATKESQAGMAMGPGAAPISLRILPAKDANDAARQAIESSLVGSLQRSVTVPTDVPLGAGAQWRTERTVDSGTQVKQTITATLRSRDGDRLHIDFSIDESPLNSVFAIPGSTQTLTIDTYTMTGNGSVVIDLGRGLPVAGSLTISGGRTLSGDDPTKPLIQQMSFTENWQ